jgi:hypothetical protein
MSLVAKYGAVVGHDVVRHLGQLASRLRGASVLHINSTRQGGGVAEILEKLVPLQCELGMDARWEIIEGSADFYRCTKSFHNALQGQPVEVGAALLKEYEETNQRTAEALGSELAAEVIPGKRPEPKPFTGDAAPLLGTYKGPSRGREMTVVVAQAPQGVTVSVNGQAARPVQWVEGLTFRDANTYITFKPNEVRWDAGGGLYVLKRQP